MLSVAKVDAVDGQNGVADVEPSAPVCRLRGMDLGNQNWNAVLLPSLIREKNKKTNTINIRLEFNFKCVIRGGASLTNQLWVKANCCQGETTFQLEPVPSTRRGQAFSFMLMQK